MGKISSLSTFDDRTGVRKKENLQLAAQQILLKVEVTKFKE